MKKILIVTTIFMALIAGGCSSTTSSTTPSTTPSTSSSSSSSSSTTTVTPGDMTLAQLAKYDGLNGKPSYVSINGIVYDVSGFMSWTGGIHFGVPAGNDATENFMTCHGASKTLDNFPKVGVLKVK